LDFPFRRTESLRREALVSSIVAIQWDGAAIKRRKGPGNRVKHLTLIEYGAYI